MNPDYFDNIKKQFGELQQGSKENLIMILERINYIITNKIKNRNIIETTLDSLLDLSYIIYDEVKPIYYRLLNYYSQIDLESANDYEQFYLEIADENDYSLKKERKT